MLSDCQDFLFSHFSFLQPNSFSSSLANLLLPFTSSSYFSKPSLPLPQQQVTELLHVRLERDLCLLTVFNCSSDVLNNT